MLWSIMNLQFSGDAACLLGRKDLVQRGDGMGIEIVHDKLAGLGLNVWLGLGIWDYSGECGNLWGQVCPLYAALWCLCWRDL